MVRVGIIGVGVMGAGHARFIKEHVPGAQVVALFDIDAQKVADLAAELGTVTVQTTDPETLMNHPDVDAVIIASPDPLHVAHLKLAIACNKPSLCEKPIATTLEDARAIAQEIKEYENAAGKTMIHFGFMRRFDASYREVRRLIDTGEYGKPTFFRTITRNVESTGATTPGLFTNIAIHDFDIFRWLFKIDFDSFFGALAKINYTGTITFESFSSAVVSPDLSSTLGIWRNLWTDNKSMAKSAREYMEAKIVAAHA